MVTNHLKIIYKYNKEDIKNLGIKETKITMKEDIFIYIAVEDVEEIRDLYRRKADIKRDDVTLRNYIPPQYYLRFSALNNICKQKGQKSQDAGTPQHKRS